MRVRDDGDDNVNRCQDSSVSSRILPPPLLFTSRRLPRPPSSLTGIIMVGVWSGQMAEWLGNRATNQKVAGSIHGRAE